jgi:hypothetical protein
LRFCQEHWDRLREAIQQRGLGDLIAQDGARAAENIKAQLEGDRSIRSYDPLMDAHWAIVNNVFAVIDKAGGNPLYLMGDDKTPEDPVEGYGPEYDGRTWPRCPLCYLNLAHEMTCSDPRCALEQKDGYDWFIDRAADDQVARAQELRKAG